MKDVAVYAGYTEVLKGAGYRLAHLRGEIAIRIVWEAVILAVLICKLCLKKKIFSCNHTRRDRGRHCSTDFFFNVVLALIGGVESAETGRYSLYCECLSTVLLPSCTIHDEWHSHAPHMRSSGTSHAVSIRSTQLLSKEIGCCQAAVSRLAAHGVRRIWGRPEHGDALSTVRASPPHQP